MVMANETALKMGLMSADDANRVKLLLQKYNLPTSYVIKDSAKFYETFFLDKKSSDSSITFIIPEGIGGVRITDEVQKELVLSVLNSFGES